MTTEISYRQFANDELGKEIVARINEKYRGTAAEIPQRDIRRKKIAGSNSYRLFAMDETVRALGWHAMLPEEAQLLIKQKLPEKKKADYDLGLVLDFSGQNHGLALKLWGALPKELKDIDRLPAVALGLQLRKSEDELIFTYGESSQLRTAKILFFEEDGQMPFLADDEELFRTGLPSKIADWEKKDIDLFLYNVAQKEPSLENLGLSRFDLHRSGDIYSDGKELDKVNYRARNFLTCCSATS